MTTYKEDSRSNLILRNQIGAYSDGVGYAIHIFENRQSLKEFMAGFTGSSASEFKRDLKVGGIKGKEYGFQNAAIKIVTQYFNTGRYIYVFTAHSSYLGNPEADMPKFFESIRFGPTQTERPIADGPGEQPGLDPSNPNIDGKAGIFSGGGSHSKSDRGHKA